MVCTRETMPSLARILSQIGGWEPAGRRVVDQTGLSGAWDFSIEWTPPGQAEEGGVDLFGALQTQLGLKLEGKEIPVPVLVIDSMERTPVDNQPRPGRGWGTGSLPNGNQFLQAAMV